MGSTSRGFLMASNKSDVIVVAHIRGAAYRRERRGEVLKYIALEVTDVIRGSLLTTSIYLIAGDVSLCVMGLRDMPLGCGFGYVLSLRVADEYLGYAELDEVSHNDRNNQFYRRSCDGTTALDFDGSFAFGNIDDIVTSADIETLRRRILEQDYVPDPW